jgi:mannosyl-3-phosphoglycerate phosphatase
VKPNRLVVVSDVDGCILDDRYSHAGSASAIDLLNALSVPLVLCSSKTRAELQRLRGELRVDAPYIIENGAALYVPHATFPFAVPGCEVRVGEDVIEFAKPQSAVTESLKQLARKESVSIVCFSDMSIDTVSRECGLSLSDARLAKLRQFDEPFSLVAGDDRQQRRFFRRLAAAGVACTHGGRYHHATARASKGLAASVLRRLYRRMAPGVLVAGLGDALNDASLLAAVDIPFIVRGRDAEATATLKKRVPNARVTQEPGPAGWAYAITLLLGELGLLESQPTRADDRSAGARSI